MKKLFVSIVLLLALTSCDSNSNANFNPTPVNNEPKQEIEVKSKDEQKQEAEVEKDSTNSTVGDYEIVIKEGRLSEDNEGNPALVLVYDWTNNSDETCMPLTSVSEKAFQDGIELESAYFVDGCDYSKSQKDVRPGKTIEVECAFKLISETSPIEVEITELISWNNDMIYAVFDPANL